MCKSTIRMLARTSLGTATDIRTHVGPIAAAAASRREETRVLRSDVSSSAREGDVSGGFATER
jgi:hypothetical protein